MQDVFDIAGARNVRVPSAVFERMAGTTASDRRGGLGDVVDRIVRKVRDSEPARRMVDLAEKMVGGRLGPGLLMYPDGREFFKSREAARTKNKKVEMTSPGSKNRWKVTYWDDQEKWVDSPPGRGRPSVREQRLLKQKLDRPSVKRAFDRLEGAFSRWMDGGSVVGLQKAVETNEVGLDKDMAQKVNRMYVKEIEKQKGDGISEREKKGLQVLTDHVNRKRRDAAGEDWEGYVEDVFEYVARKRIYDAVDATKGAMWDAWWQVWKVGNGRVTMARLMDVSGRNNNVVVDLRRWTEVVIPEKDVMVFSRRVSERLGHDRYRGEILVEFGWRHSDYSELTENGRVPEIGDQFVSRSEGFKDGLETADGRGKMGVMVRLPSVRAGMGELLMGMTFKGRKGYSRNKETTFKNRHASIVERLLTAMPKVLNLKTFMEEGVKDRREQEKEKDRYVGQVGAWLQRVTGPDSKAREIFEKATKEFPGRNTGSVLTQRKSRWVKEAKGDKGIMEFAEHVGGPDRMYGAALYLIRDVACGQKALREAKEDAERMAAKWYVESAVGGKAEEFEEAGYAEGFCKFLPPNLSFELGPTREVLSMVETFGREKKNWATMARKLAFIAARFNDIVRAVKADMASSDEVTRMCALMTAITIETGLRPGEVGNAANVKDPDTGEKVEVETFGVTTLEPRHVKFVRDGFAELRFVGKKGTEQVAMLSDADVLKALKEAVESTTLEGDTSMLFVTKVGKHVDYSEMKRYMASKWGDVTPTDFRKLKATRKFYDSLKKRSEEMEGQFGDVVRMSKAKMKGEVVSRVVAVLEGAAEEAQRALSHEDWKTTIESYVDPRVVVNFLNQGGLDDALEDILVDSKNVRLSFDFNAFIKKARRAA